MKCQQCENRIQQLLDERVDPRVDSQIREHVDSCSTCRLMLGFYASLDQPAGDKNTQCTVDRLPRPVSLRVPVKRSQASLQQRPSQTRRPQQMVLSVAIVMLVLVGAAIFAPSPLSTTTNVATGLSGVDSKNLPFELTETVVRPAANGNQYMFADWIPTRFPNISDVPFESWGNVNLVSFVPKEPADSVRGFPVAMESVAPFYRYSAEIPVVSQWANGISYTLNLLRAKFPIGVSTPNLRDNGFGAFPVVDWAKTC